MACVKGALAQLNASLLVLSEVSVWYLLLLSCVCQSPTRAGCTVRAPPICTCTHNITATLQTVLNCLKSAAPCDYSKVIARHLCQHVVAVAKADTCVQQHWVSIGLAPRMPRAVPPSVPSLEPARPPAGSETLRQIAHNGWRHATECGMLLSAECYCIIAALPAVKLHRCC